MLAYLCTVLWDVHDGLPSRGSQPSGYSNGVELSFQRLVTSSRSAASVDIALPSVLESDSGYETDNEDGPQSAAPPASAPHVTVSTGAIPAFIASLVDGCVGGMGALVLRGLFCDARVLMARPNAIRVYVNTTVLNSNDDTMLATECCLRMALSAAPVGAVIAEPHLALLSCKRSLVSFERHQAVPDRGVALRANSVAAALRDATTAGSHATGDQGAGTATGTASAFAVTCERSVNATLAAFVREHSANDFSQLYRCVFQNANATPFHLWHPPTLVSGDASNDASAATRTLAPQQLDLVRALVARREQRMSSYGCTDRALIGLRTSTPLTQTAHWFAHADAASCRRGAVAFNWHHRCFETPCAASGGDSIGRPLAPPWRPQGAGIAFPPNTGARRVMAAVIAHRLAWYAAMPEHERTTMLASASPSGVLSTPCAMLVVASAERMCCWTAAFERIGVPVLTLSSAEDACMLTSAALLSSPQVVLTTSAIASALSVQSVKISAEQKHGPLHDSAAAESISWTMQPSRAALMRAHVRRLLRLRAAEVTMAHILWDTLVIDDCAAVAGVDSPNWLAYPTNGLLRRWTWSVAYPRYPLQQWVPALADATAMAASMHPPLGPHMLAPVGITRDDDGSGAAEKRAHETQLAPPYYSEFVEYHYFQAIMPMAVARRVVFEHASASLSAAEREIQTILARSGANPRTHRAAYLGLGEVTFKPRGSASGYEQDVSLPVWAALSIVHALIADQCQQATAPLSAVLAAMRCLALSGYETFASAAVAVTPSAVATRQITIARAVMVATPPTLGPVRRLVPAGGGPPETEDEADEDEAEEGEIPEGIADDNEELAMALLLQMDADAAVHNAGRAAQALSTNASSESGDGDVFTRVAAAAAARHSAHRATLKRRPEAALRALARHASNPTQAMPLCGTCFERPVDTVLACGHMTCAVCHASMYRERQLRVGPSMVVTFPCPDCGTLLSCLDAWHVNTAELADADEPSFSAWENNAPAPISHSDRWDAMLRGQNPAATKLAHLVDGLEAAAGSDPSAGPALVIMASPCGDDDATADGRGGGVSDLAALLRAALEHCSLWHVRELSVWEQSWRTDTVAGRRTLFVADAATVQAVAREAVLHDGVPWHGNGIGQVWWVGANDGEGSATCAALLAGALAGSRRRDARDAGSGGVLNITLLRVNNAECIPDLPLLDEISLFDCV